MDESTFKALMGRARILSSDYGAGYQTGLRRHYHGERFGDPKQLAALATAGQNGDPRVELGRGYRDGLAGREPSPLNESAATESENRQKTAFVYLRDAQGLLSRHVVAGMTQAQHRAQYSVGPETDTEVLAGWPENFVRWHGHVGYATTVSFVACEVSPGGRGGWTVCMREGGRRAGYINRATDAPGGLTMHQAQAMAESFGRDFARHGLLHDAREVV